VLTVSLAEIEEQGRVARVEQTRDHWSLRALAGHPSAVLMLVQLFGVVLYPFAGDTTFGRVVFEVFGAVVLALAVWAVPGARWRTYVALGLGVPASVLSIIDAFSASVVLQGPSAVLHAGFYFWAAACLMIYMLADATVTYDELWAVGATFTLVAWGFAHVFSLVQLLQPGCFTAAVDPEGQRSWMELLFLSFTNLSATGLSDVVPVTDHARSVVMIEQLAGLGYVALFVSRLVGLTLGRRLGSRS
jgi:Ion channel